MGLGRFGGGVGAAMWLARQGARVLVTDRADPTHLKPSIELLADYPIDYHLGGHRPADLNDADLLVVSPAVFKERNPFFQQACDRGIPWTTEINLFLERCPARVVGVTGTAGKSTTAAMIHAILRGAASARTTAATPGAGSGHANCYLGGNIGRSLLADLSSMTPDDTVVLELSSYQLADLPRIHRRPDLAVYVSVWPHHLDRHGTFDAYLDCKLNMIRDASPECGIVLGMPDGDVADRVRAAARDADLRIVAVTEGGVPCALKVPGRHNIHNARCAAAAARWLGVDDAAIRTALASFPGLPHRLQFVAETDGVVYYNDSKSTSPKATIAALNAFDCPVIALVGGKRRDVDCQTLAAALGASARTVICFGEAAPALFDAIQRVVGHDGRVRLARHATLDRAVATAQREARPGDVVILSPAFPSYDAFVNYEQRGETFTSLVQDRR